MKLTLREIPKFRLNSEVLAEDEKGKRVTLETGKG